jgi:hypothetical protein
MIGRRFWVLLLVLWAIWGIVVVVTLRAAHAHDPKRPDLKPWFDQLASKKGLCCSINDGQGVQDPDWESKDGHYRVKLEDQWWDVPEDAVVTVPNLDGHTMVWPIRYNDGAKLLRYEIRCFMPGAMI